MSAVPRIPLLIGGKLVQSKTTEWRDVVNPATQEVVAQVPFATREELDLAVADSKRAFQTWRNTSQGARVRVMLNLQKLVRDNTAKLAELITLEHGKTLPDAEGEVGRGLEVIEHACAMATLQLGEYAENAATGIDVYTLVQPLGVCAGITAFNFPIMLPCFMFPIAVTAGNAFILKPSEQDPSSSLLLAQLALEAGLPPGVLNVVHGGKPAVDAVARVPRCSGTQIIRAGEGISQRRLRTFSDCFRIKSLDRAQISMNDRRRFVATVWTDPGGGTGPLAGGARRRMSMRDGAGSSSVRARDAHADSRQAREFSAARRLKIRDLSVSNTVGGLAISGT